MASSNKIRIKLANGTEIDLTRGEVNAVERMARQNGTDPEKVQYDPGHVRFDTLVNLRRKGLLVAKDRLLHFAPGVLPVMGPTIHSDNPFTLTRA
jgi:hypothetical protein